MKTARYITLIIVLAIVFSVWSPTAVLARPTEDGTSNTLVKDGLGMSRVSIANNTGGTLNIKLVAKEHTYYFSTSKRGKYIFEIPPGKYTYTLTSYKCPGSITKIKTFREGSAHLEPARCQK
jgi:hypothetical protein